MLLFDNELECPFCPERLFLITTLQHDLAVQPDDGPAVIDPYAFHKAESWHWQVECASGHVVVLHDDLVRAHNERIAHLEERDGVELSDSYINEDTERPPLLSPLGVKDIAGALGRLRESRPDLRWA